jgi:DNA-binding transcriptional regulator PaaX
VDSKYSVKNLTKDILILLAAGTLLIPLAVTLPGLPLALKPFLKRKNYQPARIKNTLKRLSDNELISISQEKDGSVIIKILDKGQQKILRYKIDEVNLDKQKWDGFWRIVIFDIPEKQRSARDFLRAKMKEIGFYTLQKSVLITPWDCREVINFIKYYYDVGEYVELIIAKSIDQESKYKNYFQIKQ